jgi:hypothetical protein
MPKDPPSWLLVSALAATSACTFHPEYRPQTVTVLAAPDHVATLIAAAPSRDAEPSLDERCDDGDTSACLRLAIAYERAGGVTPTDLHRARWYYSAACGQGDMEACDEARRLMDEEPTLPPSTEDPRADVAPESAAPGGAPGTRVVGPVNVYGGTVYFGPVTNVFVGEPRPSDGARE